MPVPVPREAERPLTGTAGGCYGVTKAGEAAGGSGFRLTQPPQLPPLFSAGLFEQRVEQYLEELPDTEQSGVNKFLRGLGEENLQKFF